LKVDPSKIKEVMNWQVPKNVGEIRCFLGLTGYYQRFIQDFSKIASSLTKLTRKNNPFVWSEEQEEAFVTLRKKLCEAPILVLPEGTEDMIVYSDASYSALGCVLMQHGKVIAYASSQLKKYKENYPTHDLKFVARWLDLLKDYDCEIRYHPDDSRGVKTRQGRIYIPFRSHVKDLLLEEAHKSKYWIHPGATKMYLDMKKKFWWPGRELASTDVVLATTKKIETIRERLKAAQDRWKSYANNRRGPIEFNVGDFIMLKVSQWKGVLRFKNKGKLSHSKKKKMVNTHHKKVLNASTSKGAEPSANDVEHDDNDNGSSSGFEGLDYGGFTEEETKALRSMTNKKELKAFRKCGIMNNYRNDMTTYCDFTACDVPKFDGALDPIASTRWLAAVEDDLLSRARVREADLLRKKNKEAKETKKKIEFGDHDVKKPKHDKGRKSEGTKIKTPCKKCHKTHLGSKVSPVINLQGREIIIYGDKRKGDFKLCSVMKAMRYLSRGCRAFMAHVINTSFEKKSMEDVPIVNEFLDVFPEELSGISPERQVEFRINLIPGATPIAKTPYRLAPSEMKELMGQLQELLNKGFIRPSSSPWRALILFVKKGWSRGLLLKIYSRLFKITSSLTKLTRKNTPFVWSEEQEEAFVTLRKKLCEAPILVFPKGTEDMIVYSDASYSGLGCVLMQHCKVIAYASMQLKKHEENYLTYDLELAVSLQYFLEKKDPNMRQQRWLDLLKDYDCEIRYHPAAHVEALEEENWKSERITSYIPHLEDDSRRVKTRQGRIYIPFQSHVKDLLLEEAHKSKYSIHPGATKMYLDMKKNYWWPARHRVSFSIVLDRDGRFTSNLWQDFQEELGMKLHMSMPFHPQTDGQSKRTILTLKDMLRVCVIDFGSNWDVHLPLKVSKHGCGFSNIEKIETIRERLKAIQDRWKSYANNRRRPIKFNEEDFVMLKRVGEVAYVLELPKEMRGIHNTLHVSYLRKCVVEESSVITLDDVEIDPELTSREEPITILGRKSRQLRNKIIPYSSLSIEYEVLNLDYAGMRTPWTIKGVLRIQQYLQHEHYALWEVIEFGDSYKAPLEDTAKDKGLTCEVSSSIKKKGRTVAITAEDMQKRKNNVKARTTLLLALLDEHQLRFSKYDTAKELWEAILKTFGGNEATKKTKKNQLKQQYGNFKAEGSETLDQTFNRDDVDTMRLDDVYNHLKVYKPEVQKRARSNSQNMAFISSLNTISGKSEVPTIQGVSTASAQVSTDSTDIDDDDIEEMDIKWNLALLSMRADRWDWSYMAEEDEALKNHALVVDEDEKIKLNTVKDSDNSADKGSDSTYEMANVLGTLGVANILTSGGLREQAERDFKIARIHAERELEMMIAELDRGNEMVAKYLNEYEQAEAGLSHDEKVELTDDLLMYERHLAQIKKYQAQQNKPATKTERRDFYMSILRSNAGWKAKDFKGMTFEQIKEKFIPVWENMQDYMHLNSKLESERLKRPRIQLGKESFKKLKTAKALGTEPTQEQQSEEHKELSEEELKKMMELVPVEELYIESLHVNIPL
nr:hypothetical protein [Tanacetum cinerariifolium]